MRLIGTEIRRAVFSPHGGRLLIDSPPRHGKSTLCSHWSPLWFLDWFPDLHTIFCGYGKDFAIGWGRKARDTVIEKPEDYSFSIRSDVTAVQEWKTTKGGGMTTTSVGGVLRGKGANLLIVDDPVKDVAEARSPEARRKLWEWWTGTARDRLEPDGTIIVVATRAYEDDLTGRILEQDKGRGRWRHIHLPALATQDDDPLGRAKGEALWAARYDVRSLEEIRADIPSWEWQTHFQNEPSPEEGNEFKRHYFRRFTWADHRTLRLDDGTYYTLDQLRVGQTIDSAVEEKKDSDYTVVLTYAITPRNDILCLHVTRVRKDVPTQWRLILSERERCHKAYPNFTGQGIEDASGGKVILQIARDHGIVIKAYEPASRDKVTRAASAIVLAEQGRIFVPETAPWVEDFLRELITFPRGANDDQVDALAYTAINLRPLRSQPTIPEGVGRETPIPEPEGSGLRGW